MFMKENPNVVIMRNQRRIDALEDRLGELNEFKAWVLEQLEKGSGSPRRKPGRPSKEPQEERQQSDS